MNVQFVNASSLQDGINLVAEDLGFCVTENASVTITVTEVEERTLSVSLQDKQATITYGGGRPVFFRGLARLMYWLHNDISAFDIAETPCFDNVGSMVDMSRNAVMNVPTVKLMLRKMALMGMNSFMLYTEDTYEIEGRPYFGYMRGRYSGDEIREMDAYAAALGIELIPCIQTLSHLLTHLRWPAADPYKSTAKTLMPGAEETYAFIEDMFKAVAKHFTSRRLHIGMDEAHDLIGGRFLKENGSADASEVYFAHLERVVEIARRYGFTPMFWSDMIFRVYGDGKSDYGRGVELPEDIRSRIPEGTQPVFWDYYHPQKAFYSENIVKHFQFSDRPVFAGGIWMWSGHVPLFSWSLQNTIPALDACREEGVRDVVATVWHNRSESCLILSLAGMAWYADYAFRGAYLEEGVRETFQCAVGCSYDDFIKTEFPDELKEPIVCRSMMLLFNDPLLGLLDKHIEGMDTAASYTKALAQLEGLGEGVYAPAFEMMRCLAAVLVHKADFGVRLKRAYDDRDRQALTALRDESALILEGVRALHKAHGAAWMTYSKPQGWEPHDIRYGGLEARMDTVRERLTAFLDGTLARIEELEEERLPFRGEEGQTLYGVWVGYSALPTANLLND